MTLFYIYPFINIKYKRIPLWEISYHYKGNDNGKEKKTKTTNLILKENKRTNWYTNSHVLTYYRNKDVIKRTKS